MTQILLPELGEDIKDAVLACWHVKEGQAVKKDDDVVELVTDKATFNVPSPVDGTIKIVYFQEGDRAPIGAVLADIEA